MKKNIGTTDRILRFLLAVLFLGLAFIYESWILALIGLFVLYEAIASWCVLYQLIGKNTCPVNRKESDNEE